MITVSNLSKTYGLLKKTTALSSVDLKINEGEVFGLIGPNGAGKTTLLGCLLGLLRPSSGSIFIHDKPVHNLKTKALTGFIPERPNFDSWMTVHDFLWYHHMLTHQPAENKDKDIAAVLERVGLEADVSQKLVRKLSRGMLQRLGLAQLLIGKPRLCFMDEPSSGMDPLGMSLVHDIIIDFKTNGVTTIVSSHHLRDLEQVADRVAYIDHGKIKSIESLKALPSEYQFNVLWSNDLSNDQLLHNLASKHGVELKNNDSKSATFLLSSQEQATSILQDLLQNGLQIYEAAREKKQLIDLFLSKQEGGDK